MTSVLSPEIRVQIGGVTISPRPIRFELATDMLTPADMVTLVYPATTRLLSQVQLDARVAIRFDRQRVFAGRITDLPLAGGRVTITARDTIDRLLEESVPGTGFRLSGSLSSAFLRLVRPWFERVTFSNAADRSIRTGRGRRVRIAGEPTITRSAIRALEQWVDAGESRWGGVERLLRTFRLLAWSSGDGREFIVTRPNYSQTTQYRFTRSARGSNVLSMSRTRSLAGRYAELVLSGTQTAPGIPPPPVFSLPGTRPKKRVQHGSRGVVRDTTGDFLAEKRLLVNDSSVYPSDAQATAARLFGQQQARADRVEVSAPGFGQDGSLFTYDKVASVTLDEPRAVGTSGSAPVLRARPYFVTSATFSASADAMTTRMDLVPVGTVLV